jgi:tryptophan synthase alpha chain
MITKATTRIASLFDRLRRSGEKALIAYITAGDPDPGRTPDLVAALERGGADLIELGVPFSDPVADGPVIQRAVYRALDAGTTLRKVLAIARAIRHRSEAPLLLFTYLNPVLRYGLEAFASDAVVAGLDGCLITDLSVEEAGAFVSTTGHGPVSSTYIEHMRRHTLDTVFLAAPTSNERRLREVARHSTGFVYLVSRAGVTGERASVPESLAGLVHKMRTVTELPLAVGFGISNPEQVAEVGELADGVVVGSAFVHMIERNLENPSLEIQLESFARELKHGFRRKGVAGRS